MFVFTHKEMFEALCSLSNRGLKSWLMLSNSLSGLSFRTLFPRYWNHSLFLSTSHCNTAYLTFGPYSVWNQSPETKVIIILTLRAQDLFVRTYKAWNGLKGKGHRKLLCLFKGYLKGKTKHSDVDLSKPLEIPLIMAMQAVSTCGLYYEAWLTSGRAFSRFRVHSCPKLAVLFQTGPLHWLH